MKKLVWNTPGDYIIRVAGHGESAEYKRRVNEIGEAFVSVEDEIEDGSVGAHVRTAYLNSDRGGLLEIVRQGLLGVETSPSILEGIALPLVATDKSGSIVGLVQAMPPIEVLKGMPGLGYSRAEMLSVCLDAIEIGALWVADGDRRSGLGTALLHCCCTAYFGAGYSLVFGNYRMSSPLDLNSFYSSAGFKILSPGDFIPLRIASGRGMEIESDTDQRIFFMTQSRWAEMGRQGTISVPHSG